MSIDSIPARTSTRYIDVRHRTYDAVRRARAVVKQNVTYGPFPLPRDFLFISKHGFDFARSPVRQRIEEIKREVAEANGITVAEMMSTLRARKFTDPRHEAIAKAYVEFPHISLPSLARMFNRQDHTSILFVVKKLGVWRGGAA